MNVATVSIIRDGLGYLERFTAQLAGLRDALALEGHTLRSIVVEGDSTDGTWPALSGAFARHGLTADLGQHAHGGPAFPSIEHPQRWAQVSAVYNAALARLTAADDWVLHVEADLLWAPATLATLLGYLRDYDAVTPMVYLGAWPCGGSMRGRRSGRPRMPAWAGGHRCGRPGRGCMSIRGSR
jgi:hypothetical protein